MTRRLILSGMIWLLVVGMATAQSRTAGTWVAQVRIEIQGLMDPAPHAAFLISESMGKAGVPASQSGGSHASVRITLTPAEARELADALNAWADSPTEATLFSRTR